MSHALTQLTGTTGSGANYVDHVNLFVDGGCRGNPGPGAVSVLVFDAATNERLDFQATYVGTTTCNRAEYKALIMGLDVCAGHTRGRVTCYSDSEVVVRQMTARYRLKSRPLRRLWHEAKNNERCFSQVIYQHVGRDHPCIQMVDRAVKEVLAGCVSRQP